MYERAISFEQIQQTIEIPDYTVLKKHKKEQYKRFDNKTLRVISVEKDKYIKVVTLMWK